MLGNRDAVFVNNWIEGALIGFFFEISRGATVAGNVFVRCGRGLWVLNSADARVYNNTFVDTPASFGRTERSAAGDHFGWHPATGPDVDQREGHVFVNNLLVASEAYRGPLLQFEQPEALRARLPRPPAKEVGGNLYARATLPGAPAPPPPLEATGRQLDRTPRSIFKGPDLGRYELLHALPATPGAELLPADVRKLLGWSDEDARSPGAYPFRR